MNSTTFFIASQPLVASRWNEATEYGDNEYDEDDSDNDDEKEEEEDDDDDDDDDEEGEEEVEDDRKLRAPQSKTGTLRR